MKIHVLSDAHADFYIKERNECHKMTKQITEFLKIIGVFEIPEQDRDVFIIPGDLGHYFIQNKEVLKELNNIFKHVILVAGNHDYYLVSKIQQKRYLNNSMNKFLELKRFCLDNSIHFLDGNVICIDGYRFAGVGMFWDSSFAKKDNLTDYEITQMYHKEMNDVNYIMSGYAPYRVPIAYGAYYLQTSFNHKELFEKEKEKLNKITEDDMIDVMITHYLPLVPDDMPEKYLDDLSTTFYIFDGEEDIKRIKPKFWLFGHTHIKYNFEKFGTRFICNPFGYPGENKNKCLTLEL